VPEVAQHEQRLSVVAVFADVDGDGVCSKGDLGVEMQLFGWNMNVTYAIQPNEWVSVTTLKPPVSSMATDFCGAYFE
jgi:hypothetical protein